MIKVDPLKLGVAGGVVVLAWKAPDIINALAPICNHLIDSIIKACKFNRIEFSREKVSFYRVEDATEKNHQGIASPSIPEQSV